MKTVGEHSGIVGTVVRTVFATFSGRGYLDYSSKEAAEEAVKCLDGLLTGSEEPETRSLKAALRL